MTRLSSRAHHLLREAASLARQPVDDAQIADIARLFDRLTTEEREEVLARLDLTFAAEEDLMFRLVSTLVAWSDPVGHSLLRILARRLASGGEASAVDPFIDAVRRCAGPVDEDLRDSVDNTVVGDERDLEVRAVWAVRQCQLGQPAAGRDLALTVLDRIWRSSPPLRAGQVRALAAALPALDGDDRESAIRRAEPLIDAPDVFALLVDVDGRGEVGSEQLELRTRGLERWPTHPGLLAAWANAIDRVSDATSVDRSVDALLASSGGDLRIAGIAIEHRQARGDQQGAFELARRSADRAEAMLRTACGDPDELLASTTLLPFTDPERRVRIADRVAHVLGASPALLVRFATGLQGVDLPDRQARISRMVLEALADPHAREDALHGLVALLRDSTTPEPWVPEALERANNHPLLVLAWVEHLARSGRTVEAARVAGGPVEQAISLAEGEKVDVEILGLAIQALAYVPPHVRVDALTRLEAALAHDAPSLRAMAKSLFMQSFPGCEQVAARITVHATTRDGSSAGLETLARALDWFGTPPEVDEATELADRAMAAAGRDTAFVRRFAAYLVAHDRNDAAEPLVLSILRRHPEEIDRLAKDINERLGGRKAGLHTARWLDQIDALNLGEPATQLWRARLEHERGLPHLAEEILVEAIEQTCDPDVVRDLERELFDARRDLGVLDARSDHVFHRAFAEMDPGAASDEDVVHRGQLQLRAQIAIGDLGSARRTLTELRALCGPRGLDLDDEPFEACLLAAEDRLSTFGPPARPASLVDNAYLLPAASGRHRLLEFAARHVAPSDTDVLASAHFSIGNELMEAERYALARDAFTRARNFGTATPGKSSSWPYEVYGLHNVACTYDNEGRFGDAAAAWHQVVLAYEGSAPTSDPYLLWAQAVSFVRVDRLADALDRCVAGLEQEPHSVELLQLLLTITTQAEETCSRRAAEADAVDSRYSCPARLRSVAHREQRWRIKEATEALRVALRRRADASSVGAHLRDCAAFFLLVKDLPTARIYVDRAIECASSDASSHQLLGQWHEEQVAFAPALAAYERAATLAPDDVEIQSRIGLMLSKLGRYEAADAQFARVVARAPNHVETLIRLGDCHLDRADQVGRSSYDSAIRCYDAALTLHADGTGSKFLSSAEIAALRYQRGYCLVKQYQIDHLPLRRRSLLTDAKRDFERCLRVDPFHTKAIIALDQLKQPSDSLARPAREVWGPWTVFAIGLLLLVAVQAEYFVHHRMPVAGWSAMSFGAVVIIIAGLFMPEVLKLKVAGIELEKSAVQQETRSATLNLQR